MMGEVPDNSRGDRDGNSCSPEESRKTIVRKGHKHHTTYRGSYIEDRLEVKFVRGVRGNCKCGKGDLSIR